MTNSLSKHSEEITNLSPYGVPVAYPTTSNKTRANKNKLWSVLVNNFIMISPRKKTKQKQKQQQQNNNYNFME